MKTEKYFQVYKASAGSGKTSRMVQEFITLALKNNNPNYFKQILGITFTNKASNELKERIIETLRLIVESDPSSYSEKYFIKPLLDNLNISPASLKKRADETLTQILHQYGELSISTIDSFMHRLVRSFAKDLKLPLNFAVELDSDLLLNEAIEELIAKVGTNPVITESLEDFILMKLDDERSFRIEDELKTLAKQLLSDEAITYVKTLEGIESPTFEKAKQNIRAATKAFEKEIQTFEKAMVEHMQHQNLDVDDFNYKNSGIAGFFTSIHKRLKEKGLIDFGKRVMQSLEANTWTGAKTDLETAQKVDAARQNIQPILEEALRYIEENQGKYIIQSLILNELHSLSLLNELQKIINELRLESGKVHISEFNKRVLELVASEEVPFIFERLGERYNHILIDEFQDTSVAQWRNLMPLLENAVSKGHSNMIVGDGKQAIYRWRGGFAEQFTALPELRPITSDFLINSRFESLSNAYELQELNVNRRSCKEIVEFNNRFFEFIRKMPDYQEAIYEIYSSLIQQADDKKTGGFIQFSYLPFPKGNIDDFRKMVVEKTLATIKSLTNEHAYDYGDIALLTRNNREASILASALMEQEIPVISSEALLLNNAPDVQFLLAWYALMLDANDESALLILIFYFKRKNILDNSIEHNAVSKFIKNSNQLFNYMKTLGLELNLDEMKQKSMIELCVYVCEKFQISLHENAFVRFFLEHVWQRTVKEGNDIHAFLNWWDTKKSSLSIITPSEANAVKIMTIHKSKGLQFPIVILPFASDTDRNTDLFWLDPVEETNELLPVAVAKLSSKLQYTRFAEAFLAEQNKKNQDSINLLYVALTRPEEALYVFTSNGNSRNKLENIFIQFAELSEMPQEILDVKFGQEQPIGRQHVVKQKNEIQHTFFDDLPKIHFGGWKSRINISKTAQNSGIYEEDKAVSTGLLIHALLEKIENVQQVETVINQALAAGKLDAEKAEALSLKIHKLIAHPELKSCFEHVEELKTEQTIIYPDGSIKRPDRIVKTADGWVVLDFKTGLKKDSHFDQLRQYQSALEILVNAPVKAILAYIGDEIVIEKV